MEDSSGGNAGGEIILEKNTDDYIVDMKRGNSNILVIYKLLLFSLFLVYQLII